MPSHLFYRLVTGEDACATGVLALLLLFVAGRFLYRPGLVRAMAVAGLVAGIADALYLLDVHRPAHPGQLPALALVAVVNGFLAAGVAGVVLALLAIVHDHILAPALHSLREQAIRQQIRASAIREARQRLRREEEERRAAAAERERLAKLPPPPPPPPPPTQEELLIAARLAHDEEMRLAALIPDPDLRERKEAAVRRRFEAQRKRIMGA